MVEISLECAIVGQAGTFDVTIDDGKKVSVLKKAIKKEKMYQFPADELQLFLAKTANDWLDAAGVTAVTLDEHGHPRGFAQMNPLLWLKNAKNFGENFQPGEDQVHVLVVVHDFLPNKRFCSKRVEVLENIPEVITSQDNRYRTLPAALMDKCGLKASRDLMMFCRPGVHELLTFLEDEVVEKLTRGHIVGPPGTGKSVCTLSFVASLNRDEWNVVWIHLSTHINSCLVMGAKQYWIIEDLRLFEVPRVAHKKLFLCLDGYRETSRHEEFRWKLNAQLNKTDRFLTCSSMATVGKKNTEDDDKAKVKYFCMYSWTRDEYLDAISNQTFRSTVESKFDATSISEVNAEDDIADVSEDEMWTHAADLKFYYAGGSCRFMFEYPTWRVKEVLETAIERAEIKTNLIKYCNGAFHKGEINTLYGMQRDGPNFGRFPLSSFVVSLFAKEGGKEVIEQLAARLNASNNPSMDGYLFEWLFFASVRTHNVKLYADRETSDELPQANVLPFDPTKRFKLIGEIEPYRGIISCCHSNGTYDIICEDGDKMEGVAAEMIQLQGAKRGSTRGRRTNPTLRNFKMGDKVEMQPTPLIKGDKSWLQPIAWNQGGYDAVYFDAEQGKVIFIQVTRSSQHDFKMLYFYRVLLKLQEAKMRISSVVVYFVVKPANWMAFKIGNVEGRGLLELVDPSWTCPEENHVKKRVKKRAFDAAPVA